MSFGAEKAGIEENLVVCTYTFTINEVWSEERGIEIAEELIAQIDSCLSQDKELKSLRACWTRVSGGCIDAVVILYVITGISALTFVLTKYGEAADGFETLKRDIHNIMSRIKRVSKSKSVCIKKADYNALKKALEDRDQRNSNHTDGGAND